ncbi:hypothetical protein [Dokdonella sp.]|uniref:hypothetical protein n=1 Tax=Dokdonella sp. TaxID=2291710 RepID=UPI001AFD18E3|nr:hypothetical protein [Dokdonella sp.]MBO9662028.1 DUF2723 domain-containing protein [Dokdonella sp.]
MNARKDFPENPPAPRWPIALYGSIALAGLLLAFVGLSASSYWVDELFTLYVVDPQVDVAEMMQRILRDVHPPLYYLVLDGWSAVFGQSEAATRSLSAICGVLAVLVFAWGARHVARPLAIAFACAVATTSVFWFEQAQNARSYAFLMLLTAGLLAAALHLRRRTRESSAFPFAAWLTLTVLGLAASQTHSYLLLGTGVLLLYLIATLPDLRLRLALVASGVVTLGAYVLFLWFQLHATTHDFGASWFRGDFDFIQRHIMRAMRNGMSRQAMLVAGVLLLVLLVRKWRRRGEPAESRADDDANWAAGLGAFVIVGGIAAGIAVTKLFTPSFSFRNVLTFVPFAWLLLARLYDVAGPRARTRAGTAAVVLIAALLGWQQVVLARGRALPRNEPWRESAEYVRELTACAASPLPGLALPEAYGGLSSGGRALVADYYHGHYLPAEVRTQILTPPEIRQRYLSAPAHSGDACPLIAWNVHALGEARALTFAAALADLPAFRGSGVAIQEFAQYSQDDFSWRAKQEGFVFLRADAEVRTLPRADRILVRRIDEAVQQERKTFLIERWRGGERIGEQRMSVPADALGIDPLREWRKIAKKE